MTNFKRGKPKEKKTIEYGTPKELQKKSHSSGSNPAKKPSWYCKKLKGKHDFIRTGAEPVKFMNSDKVFVYLKCRGCFKQKIETKTRYELQEEKAKDESQVHIVHPE
jgi:hypothetical protein